MITEEEAKLVDGAKNKLMEHFDTVRIFVTKHDGPTDKTACYTVGGGNIFAQQGLTHDWLARTECSAALGGEIPEEGGE